MEGYIPLSSKRHTVRDRVARHQLVSFFVLTCTISSLAFWLTYQFDLGVVNGFGIIGSTGPALAAMIVSALLEPERSAGPARRRWWLFAAIAILTLAMIALRRLWITPEWLTVAGQVTTTVAYPTSVAFVVDVLAAGTVAFILSGVRSPILGVRDLLHSLRPLRLHVRWYWWAIALGLYPAVIVLGNVISSALRLQESLPSAPDLSFLLVLDVILTFLYILVGGGGLEEPGWRGFALPHLQKRFSPLRASLIVGVLWTFWHWPLFWFDPLMGGPLTVFSFALTVIPLAFLFTAVFNATGGSLPIVILLHTSINVTPIFLPASSLGAGLWLLLTVGTALWLWRQHRPDARI